MRKRILFAVEKKRVLVPVGEPCAFGCRYCYTRGGEVGLSRVRSEEILSRFQQFMHENTVPFETIQFGYDGDPFARPERGIAMLQQLALTRKHVNFSTKALLDGPVIEALHKISAQMEMLGTTLSALISLSCWDSAPKVEPHTPAPSERMLTIKHLTSINVPAFIAVRPILPHIPDSEYERIVDEGLLAGCEGFILGPLYADDRGLFVRFIPPAALAATPSKTGVVSWSAHTPTWTRYEDTARLQRLLLMIERKGGRVFLSSSDAMDLVQQRAQAA
jgi:DNA repair photolyase